MIDSRIIYENLKTMGDEPQARFGHTITAISKFKIILFGGATGVSGNFAMTNDSYIFNAVEQCWFKLSSQGVVPSPRAAHAAATIESMQMVVYGGATGGGSLASDDLYLLDLRQSEEQAQWITVPVIGPTPGRRYGHIMTFCLPYIIIFGGNTGTDPVNDVWCLSIEKAPFSWQKIQCYSEAPSPRVYLAASQCLSGSASGMLVLFGGRAADQTPLNDTWGLRKHRKGTWDWVKAPYKVGTHTPTPRYQHSAVFVNSELVIIGGRTISSIKTVPFETYDTETSEWRAFPSIRRFRHSCCLLDGFLYVYGGFDQEYPNVPTDIILKVDSNKLLGISMSNAKLYEEVKCASSSASKSEFGKQTAVTLKDSTMRTANAHLGVTRTSLASREKEHVYKLSQKVHVAVSLNPENPDNDYGDFVRKISLFNLQEESKKLGKIKVPLAEAQQNPKDPLYSMFLNFLLKPSEYSKTLPGSTFIFRKDHIIELARECRNLVAAQPIVINLRPPVKIFGNLYGQFQDLMRFFEAWRAPIETVEGGDIDSMGYIFLGNFVDRGSRSLETICLLMALKLKYPDSVYLIRGSHEDRMINREYGLGEECTTRLHEDINNPSSVFQAINDCFNYLPLAALVEQQIFCIHGGIGPGLQKIEDLLSIARPIELAQDSSPGQAALLCSLWSDPTESNHDMGYRRHFLRDPGKTGNIVRFGPDKLEQFISTNQLGLVVRAHEIAPEGIDYFSNSQCLTVTSCTDYCGKCNNSACILVIQKTLNIVPKVLSPLGGEAERVKFWIDTEETLKVRPPTPPRCTES